MALFPNLHEDTAHGCIGARKERSAAAKAATVGVKDSIGMILLWFPRLEALFPVREKVFSTLNPAESRNRVQ